MSAVLHLDDEALANVRYFIERHDLHDPANGCRIPIKAAARAEGWKIHFASELGSVYGYALVAGAHRHMWINEDVAVCWQTMTVAHEVAHALLGHHGASDVFVPRRLLSEQNTGHNYRQEMEANTVAAMLLIPDRVIDMGLGMEDIRDACRVPLLAVYRRLIAADPYAMPVEDEVADQLTRMALLQQMKEQGYERNDRASVTLSEHGVRATDADASRGWLADYRAAS